MKELSRRLLTVGSTLIPRVGCGFGKNRQHPAYDRGDGQRQREVLGCRLIRINPTDASKHGASIQGVVKEGNFRVDVPPGKWLITFPVGSLTGVRTSGPPVKSAGDVIPPRYRDSIEVEITGPDGSNTFDSKSR